MGAEDKDELWYWSYITRQNLLFEHRKSPGLQTVTNQAVAVSTELLL